MALGECATKLAHYYSAMIIYKKALELAYVYQDHDAELKLYDRIGSMHYYLGDLKKAEYYHLRSLNGLLEESGSPSRDKAKLNLKQFIPQNRVVTLGAANDMWSRLITVITARQDPGNVFCAAANGGMEISLSFLRDQLDLLARTDEFSTSMLSPRSS